MSEATKGLASTAITVRTNLNRPVGDIDFPIRTVELNLRVQKKLQNFKNKFIRIMDIGVLPIKTVEKWHKNIEKLIFEEKFPTEWRKRKKVFNTQNNKAENHQNMPI